MDCLWLRMSITLEMNINENSGSRVQCVLKWRYLNLKKKKISLSRNFAMARNNEKIILKNVYKLLFFIPLLRMLNVFQESVYALILIKLAKLD